MKRQQLTLPEISSNNSTEFEESISLYHSDSKYRLSVPDSPSNVNNTKEFVYLAKYSEIFSQDLSTKLSVSYYGSTPTARVPNIFSFEDFNNT